MVESERGGFFAYIARSPRVANWLFSRSKNGRCERLVQDKLEVVASSWEDEGVVNDVSSTSGGSFRSVRRLSSSLDSSFDDLLRTQTYVLPGGGVTVRMSLQEVVDDLWRVTPCVYTAPDNSAAVVFSGYLSNFKELAATYEPLAGKSPPSRPPPPPTAVATAATAAAAAPSLEQHSSIGRSLDQGALTASLVLSMYRARGTGHEAVLLSELQGRFAFVVYDAERRTAFAARDASGAEPLWYRVDADGGLAFAGSLDDMPAVEGLEASWRQLLPGHYLTGRGSPREQQFALTPTQLAERLAREGLGGGVGAGWGSRRGTAAA